MPEHNPFGLMELVVVLGLAFWFWQSQVAALRKATERAGHPERPQPKDNDKDHPPSA